MRNARNTDTFLATGLGWFSIALGLAELLAPRQVRDLGGAPAPTALMRGYGLREIGAGVAILASKNPNQMVWSRVAGDVLDLATLAPGLSDDRRRGRAGASLLTILLITAVDIYAATREQPRVRNLPRGYRA